MKSYSLDLRERVVRAVRQGMSRHEVVSTFGISLSTLKRWLALAKQGALAPQPRPGLPPLLRREAHPLLEAQLLEAQLRAHPDATLQEHAALWQQNQGQQLSRATMARAILRLDYTHKKRV
jgi:transposase